MTTVSTERELFEAWAVTESFNIDRHYDDAGGEYHRVTTRWAWMAWQAARSADTGGARWLPIETAPDKTPFHAIAAWPLDAGGYYVEEAWWDYTRREWWPANTDYTDAHGSAIYPTHWMPLPEPPPAAPGGPAGARRPDENSPSGPSDRALNPQPEAVDHDRGAL